MRKGVAQNKVTEVLRDQVVESIKCPAKEPDNYPEEKCGVTEGF